MKLKPTLVALAALFILFTFAPNASAQNCNVAGDCDDSNVCTDDTCESNLCVFSNNIAPCNDGLSCSINDICTNGTCRGQDNCAPGEVCSAQAGMCVTPQISFGKSILDLNGVALNNPTSIQFGPDGKLYLSQQSGSVRVLTITRNGANDYQVSADKLISLVKNTPNHNDDGALNTSQTKRLTTGILVTGTAQNPVIYVTSADPRIGGGANSNEKNIDSNSGILHKLTPNGSGGYNKIDLVRGMPRSEENHNANGMALSQDGTTLYLGYGGHTNMGAPSNNFVFLPEYALSAAILSIDLAAIGNTTYDIPTLDDEDRPNACSAGMTGSACSNNNDCDTSGGAGDGVCNDVNDPFGGGQGKNQAKLVPGGPVQVFAAGMRNPYDVVVMENGRMYSVDNGPNGGWGGTPVNEGPAGNCTNAVSEPGQTFGDGLHFITGAGYYGGHPNPTRANMANTFNTSNPQSPVSSNDPRECDYRTPGSAENGSLHVFSHSTNGLDEYRAGTFAGQLAGQLITSSFDNVIYRVQLNSAGDVATLVTPLFSNVGGTSQDPGKPLDVTAQDDGEIFPGSIWVADYGSDEIIVFEPADVSNCNVANDPLLDEDLDGYDNADEIDNGTDPCSAADFPSDNDGDFISNLNDPDDDNDGWLDHLDPFAIDPMNGKSRSIPFTYGWENDDPFIGGIEGLGWTGLMSDGTNDWESFYDSTKMTAGGAAGVLTVDEATEGDALGNLNSQEFGFQMGIDVPTSRTGTFTVHTRIVGPFLGITPQDFQSMGMFIGNGDQDNYFKVVTSAGNGGGSIETTLETGGTVTGGDFDNGPSLPGPDAVDLFLIVDPDANTVRAAYTTTSITQGQLVPIGTVTSIPASWLDDPDFGLAVGVISTSRGAAPAFPATWDFMEVFNGTPGCFSNADCNDGNQCTSDLCVNGTCQSFSEADGTTCDDQASCTLSDQCTGGVCVGTDDCPFGEICNGSTDMCEASNADSDNDGLLDSVDPCPSDVRNFCFGPIAEDATFGQKIRVNANVSSSSCSGTRTDCAGNAWFSDFGYNNAASAFGCNLAGGCVIAGLPALFGCSDTSTEDLLQCEHFDQPTGDPLSYTFNVPDGDYLVNLFFANTFDGTANVGDRFFDVTVEGAAALTNFDQVAAAGGSGIAVLRSVVTTVNDNNGLTIALAHVNGGDNPAIKAIEIFEKAPTTTTTVTTTTTTTTTTTMAGCTDSADCSDGNLCSDDVCDTNTGQCSNPAIPFGSVCTDDNVCTDDQCDGTGVCISENNADPCDDAQFCTTTDTCAGGTCVGIGDPCTGGDVCNENTDMCEPPPCVDITAPSSIVCYENRICTIPISLVGNGLEVSDAGTTIGSGLNFDCGPECLAGAAATNGTCLLETSTCSVQVADAAGFISPFSDGELARVDVVCTEPGTDQICLSGNFANDPVGAAQQTCTEDCVNFECGTCQSGDCNQTQIGGNPVDAGDPVCVVNCLVGSPPAGADCVCASDCNCVGGVEASDPVCAVLRVIGSFASDPCSPEEAVAASRVGDYAQDLRIKKAKPRLLRDGRRRSVLLSLKGTSADQVAGLRLALSAEGAIGRIRFVRRMRTAGWHLVLGRPGTGHIVIAVTPPMLEDGVPAIYEGKLLRVRLKGGTTDVTISDVQFGSKRGLPLRVIPVVKTP